MDNTKRSDPAYTAAHPNGGPGVLVLHPWWGLNDTVRRFCDRLAAEGFVVAAPDLFAGQVAVTIPEAETLAQGHDSQAAPGLLLDAVNWLATQPGIRGEAGLGVVGFSFGAAYALELSRLLPEKIGAVVLFYGTYPTDFSAARAAYQGHFAEHDPFEGPAEVDALQTALSGHPLEMVFYPGTGHWFMEPDRPEYNPAAAALAWERTLAFLQRELR